jgi:hypothetical protein
VAKGGERGWGVRGGGKHIIANAGRHADGLYADVPAPRFPWAL